MLAVLGVTVIAIIIGMHIIYGAVDSNGNLIEEKQETKLPCLKYSDGTLAVIKFSNRGGCGADSGAMNTISYFLKKGYHIDAVTPNSQTGDMMIDMGAVFMSR